MTIIGLASLAGCGVLSPTRTSIWNSDIPIGGMISPPIGMTRPQAVSEFTSRSVLLLGTPYRPGGTNPKEGFDCSGLVAHVIQDAFRLRMPRTSEDQASIGIEIQRHALEPGDLVFFNTRGKSNSHVGVYLGDNRFVHAPNARGVVRIESMDQSYWVKRFDQARRIIALQ